MLPNADPSGNTVKLVSLANLPGVTNPVAIAANYETNSSSNLYMLEVSPTGQLSSVTASESVAGGVASALLVPTPVAAGLPSKLIVANGLQNAPNIQTFTTSDGATLAVGSSFNPNGFLTSLVFSSRLLGASTIFNP